MKFDRRISDSSTSEFNREIFEWLKLYASMRRADRTCSASRTFQSASPGEGEVRVRHVAVGMNFADTYFRQGYYPVPLPNGMGVEASGVIEAVGPNVERVSASATASPTPAARSAPIRPSA